MGRVRLQTDHKPLVPLINTYDLDKTPLHATMAPLYSPEHVPGKQLVVADALSRHPLDGEHKSGTVDQVRAYVNTAVASKPIKPPIVGQS